MRRLVPVLLCLALPLAGCPESHGTPGSDGGPRGGADALEFTDAGPRPDGPLLVPDSPLSFPDAPSHCPLAAFDAFCTDTGNAAVPAGRAALLEVFLGSIDGCYCGEEIECTGSLGADGVLDLTSAVCAESLCDACLPRALGVCHLPALAEGTYPVRFNGGATAFELTASNTIPFSPVDTCVAVPHGGCDPTWPPVPMHVDSACADTSRTSGTPIPIEIVNLCGTCGSTPGPCVAEQIAPNEFRLRAQELGTNCDIDCPAICGEVSQTCWLPALDAGTYTVHVVGAGPELPLTVVVGDPTAETRPCVGLLTGGGGG